MSTVSTYLRSIVNGALAPFSRQQAGERFDPVDDLLAKAERRTGLRDWGDPHFRDGLDALLGSLEEVPDLTPLGVVTFSDIICQALVSRLRFVRDSVQRSELNSPVIITGLPRSGTTALHRLLGLDPGFYSPPLWELRDPFATSTFDLRRWRTSAGIMLKNRLLPDLDRKHFTRADTPEECTLLLANSFASPLFWDLAPLDGYLEWYQSTSQRPAYVDYRRQLEVLQAIHPDQRLLLKAPAHLGNLAVLHEMVPEALLIQTHRDPTSCFFSHCSLRETLGLFVVDRPSRKNIAGQVRRVFEHDLRTSLEFHEDRPTEVTHIACSVLGKEPLEVLRGLCCDLDLGWSQETAGRAAAYLERNPRGRHGRHHVSDDDWGISREDIDQLFSVYRERFAGLLPR
jgi:hypothetical protein